MPTVATPRLMPAPEQGRGLGLGQGQGLGLGLGMGMGLRLGLALAWARVLSRVYWRRWKPGRPQRGMMIARLRVLEMHPMMQWWLPQWQQTGRLGRNIPRRGGTPPDCCDYYYYYYCCGEPQMPQRVLS